MVIFTDVLLLSPEKSSFQIRDLAGTAMIGQYAENVFFGKEDPVITPVHVDFSAFGHSLCIIDPGADQA